MLEVKRIIMRKTKSFVLCILHSEVLALWLGAALGTLNWLLFALLPLVVAGLFIASRAEEAMLRSGQPTKRTRRRLVGSFPRCGDGSRPWGDSLGLRTHRRTAEETAPCWRRARLTWLCRRTSHEPLVVNRRKDYLSRHSRLIA